MVREHIIEDRQGNLWRYILLSETVKVGDSRYNFGLLVNSGNEELVGSLSLLNLVKQDGFNLSYFIPPEEKSYIDNIIDSLVSPNNSEGLMVNREEVMEYKKERNSWLLTDHADRTLLVPSELIVGLYRDYLQAIKDILTKSELVDYKEYYSWTNVAQLDSWLDKLKGL